MATSEESDDSSRDEVFYNQVVKLIIKIVNLILRYYCLRRIHLFFLFYLSELSPCHIGRKSQFLLNSL